MINTFTLAEHYKKNAMLRALAQLIPYSFGSAIDTFFSIKVEEIRTRRMREFFDELEKGKIEITSTIIENEDFLHCFFATTTAVIKTSNKEKIHFLARLLTNSVQNKNFSDVDDYEEILTILSDLSYREIIVLMLLDSYENAHPHLPEENDLKRASRFWEKFIKDIINQTSYSEDEIDFFFMRLSRTGCYETFTGKYLSDTRGKGKITPLFRRIKEIALKQ